MFRVKFVKINRNSGAVTRAGFQQYDAEGGMKGASGVGKFPITSCIFNNIARK
jgi:hypothetical protein